VLDGDNPRSGEAYRCHVCRLTLQFDEVHDQLVISPFETDHEVTVRRVERRKTLPTPVSEGSERRAFLRKPRRK
jgi:hypothetical protein